MTIAIAHLGPTGTYAEAAALACADRLSGHRVTLCPYPSIAQAIRSVAQAQADLAVVPVENSIEGSVPMTLDTLWQLDSLEIYHALILPISHALLSRSPNLDAIQTVCSHPQALAQCQIWLENHLPAVTLIPMNSTTEAVQKAEVDPTVAAIAAQRAATLYQVPILAFPINDYPDNCTRFWVLGLRSEASLELATQLDPTPDPLQKSHTSLAFSVRANVPGALVKPLEIFASRGINLSRIESRPSKRSLGDYLFFIDFEADIHDPTVQAALAELKELTEVLKIFGSYNLLVPETQVYS